MFEYLEIKKEHPNLFDMAEIVRNHSWGEEYPIDPIDELKKSEYILGCFNNKKLVGFGTINRFSSPDGLGNGLPWLSMTVVLPEFRNNGIYRELYEKRLEYLKNLGEKNVFVCTDNMIVENFLLKRNWNVERETKDESGGVCKVFNIEL